SLIGWLEIPGQLSVHVRRLETIEIFRHGIPVPASGRVHLVRCLKLIPNCPPDEHAPGFIERVPAFALSDRALFVLLPPGIVLLSGDRADLDAGIAAGREPLRLLVAPGA